MLDSTELKPKRHRRTKAEMEEARLQATSVDVNQPDPTTVEVKPRRKRRKKNDNGESLAQTLEGIRQIIVEGFKPNPPPILLPTDDESPYIFKPLAGLIARHTDVPETDNPDIRDGIVLAVALLGAYRARVMYQLGEKKRAKQNAQYQHQEFNVPEPVYQPIFTNQTEPSMADIAANGHASGPIAPNVRPLP